MQIWKSSKLDRIHLKQHFEHYWDTSNILLWKFDRPWIESNFHGCGLGKTCVVSITFNMLWYHISLFTWILLRVSKFWYSNGNQSTYIKEHFISCCYSMWSTLAILGWLWTVLQKHLDVRIPLLKRKHFDKASPNWLIFRSSIYNSTWAVSEMHCIQ